LAVSDDDLIRAARILRATDKAADLNWPTLSYLRVWALCSLHGQFSRTLDEDVWGKLDGFLICPGEHGEGITRKCQAMAISPEGFPEEGK